MKIKSIQILFFIGISLLSFQVSYANEQKSSTTDGFSHTSHTTHPPHDHHHTDHIKKLDESMRRKREDEEKSH